MPVEDELSKPLISVLIPAYRSGDMLFSAVKSVLEQDYPNIQAIISDDGTQNFAPGPLKNLARHTSRESCLRILHNDNNIGTVKNLNRALFQAEGQWVLLLAADDVLASKNVISALANFAQAQKAEWIVSKTIFCDAALHPGKEWRPTDIQAELLQNGSGNEIWAALCRDCFLPSGGTMFTRELLTRMGGFDTAYRLVEDWPLFLKLVRQKILPTFCDITSVFHRSGGVSRHHQAENQIYQGDLITAMEQEVIPFLDALPAEHARQVKQLYLDKKAIFQFRFDCTDTPRRIGWLLTHPGVIFRKITNSNR